MRAVYLAIPLLILAVPVHAGTILPSSLGRTAIPAPAPKPKAEQGSCMMNYCAGKVWGYNPQTKDKAIEPALTK